MARVWYAYDGTGDMCQTSSYILVSVKPTCINGSNLCAIYEFNGGFNPSTISSNICQYISNLLVTGLAQPQFPRGAKKYVYGKP